MSMLENESRGAVLRAAAFVEGGLVLAAIVLGWLVGSPPLAQLEWNLWGVVIGIAAAVPMVAGLVLVTRFPMGPFADLDRLVRRFLLPLFRSCTLVDLALIAALAGLGEEMLFRGVVQTGIERASGSPWLAVAGASVLFGLAHPITRTYAVLAGLIGVYLGWLFLATGNLLTPIVTHAAYDFVALVYLLREGEIRSIAPEQYPDEWSI